jgi:excisionase family DNA binding protein
VLTPAQAAPLLGLSVRAVYDLCAADLLAHHRVGVKGGAVRIEPAAVEAYKAAVTAPGDPLDVLDWVDAAVLRDEDADARNEELAARTN